MGLSWILSIDQDIVQVYYNKDIKLLSKDFVDVALKTDRCVEKAKRYYLVPEIAVSGAESRLLLVTFLIPHLMISTNEIQLGKFLGSA